MSLSKSIDQKKTDLLELELAQSTVSENRSLIINTLNEFIQLYIQIAKDALDE